MKMRVSFYRIPCRISIKIDSLAENERRLFTGILPNLYHPPETLALKSDVVGSLLVSDFKTILFSSN